MFANIQIRSRQDMETLSYELDMPCIIISISDKNVDYPIFADNSNILDVCYLSFDDEESEERHGMTQEDAQEICEFIDQWQNENIELYVHCGAGVSRSAGCAAAIMLWQWGDDSAVFDDGYYAPNMHCYRSILDAADLSYDDIQLAKKERHQLDLWQMEHADDLSAD